MKSLALTILLMVTATFQPGAANTSLAQQKVDSLVGAVVGVDHGAGNATMKTDAGEAINIQTNDKTVCLRIPAGEKTLSRAVPIKFNDIVVGDRVLAHGTKTDQAFVAQRLVVLTATDVAKKREHDLDEWRRRGVGGIVRELNAQTSEITLELRGANTGTRLNIDATKASFRRYVAGSLRFEDARASKFDELHVGDQLRALGDKNPDARSLVAEQIVSGAFKTVGVTVHEVDQAKNEIRATTLDSKKPIVVTINKDSLLHRISPPVAAAIAQRAKGEANKPGSATQATPSGPKPAGSPVIDVQQMIDSLPSISLSDIKGGDVLAVTGAVEDDEAHLVAIKVAAGVDLVLRALTPAPGKTQVVRLSAGLPAVFDFSVIPIN